MAQFSRLEDAVRKVRSATEYEAERLTDALEQDTAEAYEAVHRAHLELVDTVHRLMMITELVGRSSRATNRSRKRSGASPAPKLAAAGPPSHDPFAVGAFDESRAIDADDGDLT